MYKKYRKSAATVQALALALFLAAPTAAAAQTSLSLDLPSALAQAEAHNLGLGIESLKVAQKDLEKNSAFNRFYPSVSASASLGRLDTVYSPLLTNLFHLPEPSEDLHWNLGLGLNVQLTLSPALFRGIGQLKIDYENAVISREGARARLKRDVSKAFYQLLALKEAKSLARAQTDLAEKRYRQAQSSYEAGLSSQLNALQARVSWENRKPQADEQDLAYENALVAFKNLLGVDSKANPEVRGSLDVDEETLSALGKLSAAGLVAAFREGRIDLQNLSGTAKSLENLLGLQADTLWPSLSLAYTADPTAAAPFDPETWTQDKPFVQTRGGVSASLLWKIDGLLPGSTTWVDLSARKSQYDQTLLALEQARRAADLEIGTLVAQIKKSASALSGLKLAQDLAERSAKLSDDAYQVGTQSLMEAQEADFQWQNAKYQVLNEKLRLVLALADLDYALNAERSSWLPSPAESRTSAESDRVSHL